MGNTGLQELMVKAMLNRGSNDVLTDVLADAIVEFVPRNSREKQEKIIILDYLSYMTVQHMRARQRQIEYGSWKPDESLAANLIYRTQTGDIRKVAFLN